MRVVGILGGSGAGKSRIAIAILDLTEGVALSQDSYYRDLAHLPLADRATENFDTPEALDLPLLADHVAALREGLSVRPPIYDMHTHVRTGTAAPVEPAPLVLVEGTMLLANARLTGALDSWVYVELDDGARFRRRVARDARERGRDEASVRAQWEATVLPMHRLHVEPARETADLVVSGAEPAAESALRILALLT